MRRNLGKRERNERAFKAGDYGEGGNKYVREERV